MLDKFWAATCAPMVWVFAGLELLLFVFLLLKYIKKHDRLTFYTMLITFGLFYDAFMIALGVFVDPTKVVFLQEIRYYLHVLLIPLLLIIVAELLKVKKTGLIIFHSIAAVLMVVGIFATIVLDLVPVTISNVSRLASGDNTPTWSTIFTILISVVPVVPLIVTGVIVLVKEKTPYVLLSGLLMFIFAAAIQGDYAFYATMYGELFMVGFLTLYILRKERLSK